MFYFSILYSSRILHCLKIRCCFFSMMHSRGIGIMMNICMSGTKKTPPLQCLSVKPRVDDVLWYWLFGFALRLNLAVWRCKPVRECYCMMYQSNVMVPLSSKNVASPSELHKHVTICYMIIARFFQRHMFVQP